jgi:phytoene/squalene synthetase
MTFAKNYKGLFDQASIECSKITTKLYSTSFSLGILCLHKSLRDDIYSIYGFVRYADEIVDSFHGYNQKDLLDRFEKETYQAIHEGISLNPILNSFQHTVNKYGIQLHLIDTFLSSMRTDLTMKVHNEESFKDYILGSAEVVGLMCLHVFCKGDLNQYELLRPNAMKLGAAFQKINFLRDANADLVGLGRVYFPHVDFNNFSEEVKKKILTEIAFDFSDGFTGIKKLPSEARFGVYIAYIYYLALFKKIKNTPSQLILKERISVRNFYKMILLISSFFKYRLNLI